MQRKQNQNDPSDTSIRKKIILRFLFLGLGILVCVAIAWAILVRGPSEQSLSKPTLASGPSEISLPEPTYVGGKSCLECHAKQAHAWKGSDHDLSMALATGETVLGDFNNTQFTSKSGVTSKMTRKGDHFFITTEGPTGKEQKFQVKYTFGVRPLQQYLVEFPKDLDELPKGRIQCWTIAWDTNKKQWFDLFQNDPESYKPGDPMHWTGWANTWNHMCADCHSTNLEKKYDLKSDTYDTTYTDINVSCEACHGPGSNHVKLAKTKSWDTKHGYGLVKLKGKEKDPVVQKTQIETCAHCHSRRGMVHHGFKPGDRFADHFSLALIEEGLYHADGQIRGEVYVHGSFLQSRMYREGIRCTDCHDPHTTKLVRQGNDLCTKCHTPGKYDGPVHHHHKQNSTGASCIECHMPESYYMVVDPRRDHSIRMPRPDLSVELGTPNACTACHLDTKSGEWEHYSDWITAAQSGNTTAKDELERLDRWSSKHVVEWYGPKRPVDPHYATAIHGGRRGVPEAESSLIKLAKSKQVGPIVRATAVSLLGNYHSPNSQKAILQAFNDKDQRVRFAAVRGASIDRLLVKALLARNVPGHEIRKEMDHLIKKYMRSFTSKDARDKLDPWEKEILKEAFKPVQKSLIDALKDPVRQVRQQAVVTLSKAYHVALSSVERAAFDEAFDNFKQVQQFNSDTWQFHVTMAGIYEFLGKNEPAESHLNLARIFNPVSIDVRKGLERQYLPRKESDKAEALWLELIRLVPKSIEARQAITEFYLDQKMKSKIEPIWKDFIKLSPKTADGHFKLAQIIAEDSDRLAEATQSFGKAVELAPGRSRFQYNYGLALNQLNRPEEGERALLEALRLEPKSPDYIYALFDFYIKRKEPDRAEKLLKDALKINPPIPLVVGQLVYFYEKQEKWDQAENVLLAAHGRAPNESGFVRNLVVFYAQRGKMDKALEYARRLVKLRPGDPGAQALLLQIEALK